MATRTRDIAPGKEKEKRGTSPSQVSTTRTTPRGRSPSAPKTNSPARAHGSTAATEKPIPNYLKPTLCSGLDTSKQQGKKPVSKTDTAQKATLLRRRSFDKPPSTSETQKSRVSPNPALRSSSSFSRKTASPQKAGPDKNVKATKEAGKQHTLYARPVNTVKKSGIYVKKQDIGSVSKTTTKEKAVSHASEKADSLNVTNHVPENETQTDDQEHSIAEADEQILQDSNDDGKGDKNLVVEDYEPINVEQTEGENAKTTILESLIVSEHAKDLPTEDQNPKIVEKTEEASEKNDARSVHFESSTILEHPKDSLLENQEPVKIEEIVQKSDNKDANVESSKTSEVAKDSPVDDQQPINIKETEVETEKKEAKIETFESPEDSEHQNAETEIVEPLTVSENNDASLGVNKEETEVTKQQELKEDTVISEINNINNTDESVAGNKNEEIEEKKTEAEEEVTSLNKKDDVASGSEVNDSTKESEVVVKEKWEAENAAPKVQIAAHGKKDSAVSNDVIEETSRKLREQRKNKVKALAGAFETVISLQDK